MATPPDIEIFGTYDRGVANKERVVLRVTAPIRLSNYFLFLGYTNPSYPNNVWPINDQFLWLNDTIMQVPGWIFVYTGKGAPSITQETITKQPAQSLYWNKDNVVLTDPNVTPTLACFSTLEIGNKPNKILESSTFPPPPPPPTVQENPSDALARFLEAMKTSKS